MSRKSFTLIELMVVIAIIGILGVVITPVIRTAIEKANVSRVIADLDAITLAVQQYNLDTGQWPVKYTSWDPYAVNPFLVDPGGVLGWDGPYLKSYRTHPWGGNYGWSPVSNYANWDNESGYWIVIDDDRFGTSAADNGALIPDSAMQRVDDTIDDGDLLTGDLRELTVTPNELLFFAIKDN
jgi:general secretion pathway protein G